MYEWNGRGFGSVFGEGFGWRDGVNLEIGLNSLRIINGI
jgi:hypothetical protein